MRLVNLIIFSIVAASAAKATPVTYNFTGTVNQVGTNTLAPVMVGQQIPIVITVEAAYPQNANGTYTSFGSSATSFSNIVLSATFAGINENGFIQIAVVNPNSLFQINTSSPQTSSGFGLGFSSPLPGALPTSAIPLTLDPSNFGVGTFSVVEAFSASQFGFTGTINGLASNGSALPEPASLGILAAGLFGAILIRRRKGDLMRNP